MTISILTALPAPVLRPYLQMGLGNGLTREELEEIRYQASADAGFPAASAVRAGEIEVLGPSATECSLHN